MQVMRKILWDKRYGGFVWHLIFVLPFIGLSLLFMQMTKGVTWFLISSALRTVFGFGILFPYHFVHGVAPYAPL